MISDRNWIPIELGQTKRNTTHDRIQNFLQQTALSQLPRREFCNRPVLWGSGIGWIFWLLRTPLSTLAAILQLGRGTLLWTRLALTVLPPLQLQPPHFPRMRVRSWPNPPARPLRPRGHPLPHRRRRLQPAKTAMEDQHKHLPEPPPQFLLSLFSSCRNLACRSIHTCPGFASSLIDHSRNSMHPGIGWSK